MAAELPQVPNLDPDGKETPSPPAGDGAAQATAKLTAAKPRAKTKAKEKTTATKPKADNKTKPKTKPTSEAKSAPKPASEPAPDSAPESAKAAAEAEDPSDSFDIDAGPAANAPDESLNESFEEVLHQTSEQTLRLVGVEETIKELQSSLDDLREEMVAGFVETRAGAQALQAKGQVDAGPDPMLGARLDAVEEQVHSSMGKLGNKLTFVLLAQGVLLVLAVVFLILSRSDTPAETKPPIPVGPAPVSLDTKDTRTSRPSNSTSKGKKKRRRR